MTGSVKINNHLFFENPNGPSTVAKGFVETGSNNGSILVSLNESTVPGSVKSVFAGVRTNIDDKTGVLVTVIFSDAVDPNAAVILLTIQQDGAARYGDTIPFIAKA